MDVVLIENIRQPDLVKAHAGRRGFAAYREGKVIEQYSVIVR